MRTQEPRMFPGPGDRLPEEAVAVIRERTAIVPEFAVVLGSGLGPAIESAVVDAEISFDGLPGFPAPSVPGHPGRLVAGTLADVPMAAFLGRIHYYEGHPLSLCTLPVRVARALGAHTMVLTGAVGGIDPAFSPGDLVVAADHVNLMGDDPLRGWRRPDGTPPFVDLSELYAPELAALAARAGEELGLRLGRGVYAAMPGPTYETPAEIELLRRVGATVVGMSVVPEALAAAALGMRVLGLFVVTNAAGVGAAVTLDHQEVIRVGAGAAAGLGRLLARLAPELGRADGPGGSEDGSDDGL